MESEDPVLVTALTLSGLLVHFPDRNNNSCPSLYLGMLGAPEIIKALSSSEERCLETQGDIMIPAAWVGGVESMREVSTYN